MFYTRKDSVIGASTGAGNDTENTNGIVHGHAYTVLDVKQVDKFQLVQLRNPWGTFEWKVSLTPDPIALNPKPLRPEPHYSKPPSLNPKPSGPEPYSPSGSWKVSLTPDPITRNLNPKPCSG